MENVVVAHAGVEQVAGQDARWIAVVIRRPGGGYFDKRRTVLRRETGGKNGCRVRSHAVTRYPGLELLVGSQEAQIDRRLATQEKPVVANGRTEHARRAGGDE